MSCRQGSRLPTVRSREEEGGDGVQEGEEKEAVGDNDVGVDIARKR